MANQLCHLRLCCLPGSSVYVIFQARIQEWVAISYAGYLPNPGIESTSKMIKMVNFMLCVFRANLKYFSHTISLNLHHSAALLPVLQMRKLKSSDCCQITKRG